MRGRRWQGTAALVALLLGGPVLAAPPRSEEQATRIARALVETASRGHIDEAFATANGLRRADDDDLAQALVRRQKVLSRMQPKYGGPGRVLMPTALDFGGCVTREFAVFYPNRSATWVLKFRRNRDGYYLYDLDVHA